MLLSSVSVSFSCRSRRQEIIDQFKMAHNLAESPLNSDYESESEYVSLPYQQNHFHSPINYDISDSSFSDEDDNTSCNVLEEQFFDIELMKKITTEKEKLEVTPMSLLTGRSLEIYKSFIGLCATKEDISKDQFEISDDLTVFPTFNSMGMNEKILNISLAYGFEKPTQIQQWAIKPIMEGRDLVLQANDNVETMVTFAMPIVQIINTKIHETQALVISPTTQSAIQTRRLIHALGSIMGVKSYACFGNDEDLGKLNHRLHVISGIPEDILSLIAHRHLKTKSIRLLIIDQFDEILRLGLEAKIDDICKYLSPKTQIVIVCTYLLKSIANYPKKLGITKRSMKTLLIPNWNVVAIN